MRLWLLSPVDGMGPVAAKIVDSGVMVTLHTFLFGAQESNEEKSLKKNRNHHLGFSSKF
jgi:hypothetical protein